MNPFGSLDSVTITILVDNHADLMVKPSDRVKYFTDKPLLAEHGFSALVHLNQADEKFLWDAGISKTAMMENIRLMKLDFKSISKIILSHGHQDHYEGISPLLQAMELLPIEHEWEGKPNQQRIEEWLDELRLSIIAHPAALRERWWLKEDGTWVGPDHPPPFQTWQENGARMVYSEKPFQIAPGCWTTGFIPRTGTQEGKPSRLYYRSGDDFLEDEMEDDQALVMHVKGKGLVVLTGCAHAGILNTLHHAREISGVDQIYAIIGGFHLSPAKPEEIAKTVDTIRLMRPQLVIPCHCTGFQAMAEFSRQMPAEFIQGVVGATFMF
jgi:7,8-dihydropterin-6-yl-methyl-4-(beta-D-ribofuranosyl)aminobenzene 5'-phosphate synthase